jgi:Ribbon-helix-helix protein, copG family
MAVVNPSAHGQSISKGEVHPRLMMEVSSELVELLDKLAAKSHTTRTEVLRKAVALLDVSTQAKDVGRKIGILDENDKLIQEIVGI